MVVYIGVVTVLPLIVGLLTKLLVLKFLCLRVVCIF